MPARKKPVLSDELVDQLMAGRDPSTMFDKGGLLDDLKRSIAERVLNAEMDHHLAAEVADGGSNSRNGYGKKTVMRAVPLSSRAQQILAEHLPWPFSLSTLRRRVKECREALGLEHWVLHSMRHTAATRLVAKGANPAHIQKFLGHRTQAMTNRYTHLQAADIRGIADLIDE
ncbi:MAG: tyrosine-type recombinase/integrase [Geminicoccaceae bacterium]|nr:tyrosine-type recombinase/integrase [Geminicoccaceae bacterium]